MGPLSAQDLGKDFVFFLAQKPAYQRWLDSEGISTYLSVKGIQLNDSSDRLSLYLEFPFGERDTMGLMALAAWETLKTSYDQENTLPFERALLYEMNFLFEVPLEQIDILIYDTYDLMKEPNFMRFVYFYQGELRLEEKDPRYKSQEEIIKFPPPVVPDEQREAAVATFKQTHSREKVYAAVLDFARNRYESSPCEGRKSDLIEQENREVLRFKVYDLCREVLQHAPPSTVCSLMSFFGLECDMARREMLIFTVSYLELAEGIQIEIEIDGKVGSGLYETDMRRGYYPMEDDFNDAFEDYADALRIDLEKYLAQKLR